MRVFLDTNVLVSAFTTRGLCRDLFRLVLAEHEFLCGEVVLIELQRVLRERFNVPAGTVSDIIRLLRSYPMIARPAATPDISVRDPDDLWVLASALAAKAEILVTGDQDLLTLPVLPDLQVTDPRGFWALAKKSSADYSARRT
ncbi:MAG: putative toxin-antitoxin system toxin component, PIN family, partial [Gammaproteobacteria bacterium]